VYLLFLDFWYIFRIQTIKFRVTKISQYYVFAVCDNVAPWNRHQERRRMPGLQGPQPSFLSKIPICECFKELSINIRRQRSSTGLLSDFWGTQIFGTVSLDNETFEADTVCPSSSASKVMRSRKALRLRSLLQPLPNLRHHQDCQLYSWRLLVGRSPWLPLETTLDTSDTTQETTRRQLQVKCYRSKHYAKGTTIVAIAPG